MKKNYILIILVLVLSACQGPNNFKSGQNHENRFDDNPNLQSDLDMQKEYENRDIPDCHTLCYDKVQDICVDEIVDILSEGNVSENSIFNEEACQSMCLSKWTDDTRECIGQASKCDSLSSSEPYCREEEDNSAVEYIEEKEEKYSCSKACYKYKECALMSPDATAQDGNDAYASCYEECQKWSDKTINCISDTETKTPMGCMKMTQCGLAEYLK